MRLAREQRRRIDLERVAFDHLQLAGKEFAQLGQGGNAAPVALDRGDRGARLQQCAGQPARAGADLEDFGAGQVARHLGDARQQLMVEQEILPQRLACAETVPADDVTKRRQFGHRLSAVASTRRSACAAAMRIAAIIAPGLASSVPAMPKAVP